MLPAITAVLGLANTLADRLFPSEKDKAKAVVQILDALQTVDLGQLEINKIEAQSRSLFVAGWRPAIGWALAFALVVQFIMAPWFQWFAGAVGWTLPPFPVFDTVLWELMAGMLGMAGLRTFEKYKGITK